MERAMNFRKSLYLTIAILLVILLTSGCDDNGDSGANFETFGVAYHPTGDRIVV